jgi:hypothetical protein
VDVKRTEVIIYAHGRVAAGWRRAEAAYHEGLGGEANHAGDGCCASGELKAIPANMSEEG